MDIVFLLVQLERYIIVQLDQYIIVLHKLGTYVCIEHVMDLSSRIVCHGLK
jgi:hypothetical protein